MVKPPLKEVLAFQSMGHIIWLFFVRSKALITNVLGQQPGIGWWPRRFTSSMKRPGAAHGAAGYGNILRPWKVAVDFCCSSILWVIFHGHVKWPEGNLNRFSSSFSKPREIQMFIMFIGLFHSTIQLLGIFQTGPGRVEADGHEGMIRHWFAQPRLDEEKCRFHGDGPFGLVLIFYHLVI